MGKFVSITLVVDQTAYARVAQLVERDLAKVEAAGSSPVSRSGNEKEVVPLGDGFFLIIRVHFALEGSRSRLLYFALEGSWPENLSEGRLLHIIRNKQMARRFVYELCRSRLC